MLPLTSSFWSTSRMSKSAYLLSRTPRAMFSKSQNNARLRSPFTATGSCGAGILYPFAEASILSDYGRFDQLVLSNIVNLRAPFFQMQSEIGGREIRPGTVDLAQ